MSSPATRRGAIAVALVSCALGLGAALTSTTAEGQESARVRFFPSNATQGDLVFVDPLPHDSLRRSRLFLVEIDPTTHQAIGKRIRVGTRKSSSGFLAFRVKRAGPGTYGLVVRTRRGVEGLYTGDLVIGGPQLGDVPDGPHAAGDTVTLPGTFPSKRKLRVRVGGVRAKVVAKASDAISFRVPGGLPPGEHDVVVTSRTGSSAAATLLSVDGPPAPAPPTEPAIDGRFGGTWFPFGVDRRIGIFEDLPDGLVRVASRDTVEHVGGALPQVELRFPATALDAEPGEASFAITSFVVRRERDIAGLDAPVIESWYGEGTVTARITSRDVLAGGTRYAMSLTGVANAVDPTGAPRAAAPVVLLDGSLKATRPNAPPPATSARLQVLFREDHPAVDTSLSTGAVGTVVPGGASPPSPPLTESAVYTHFLGFGVREPRDLVPGVNAGEIFPTPGDAAVVEVQLTRALAPESPLLGPQPDLSAIGLDLETTDAAVTSRWYPLAVRDVSGIPGGAFPELDGYDPATDGEAANFALPSAEIEAAGYVFARFRVRFLLDDAQQAGDPVPFVGVVGIDFEFGGE